MAAPNWHKAAGSGVSQVMFVRMVPVQATLRSMQMLMISCAVLVSCSWAQL